MVSVLSKIAFKKLFVFKRCNSGSHRLKAADVNMSVLPTDSLDRKNIPPCRVANQLTDAFATASWIEEAKTDLKHQSYSAYNETLCDFDSLLSRICIGDKSRNFNHSKTWHYSSKLSRPMEILENCARPFKLHRNFASASTLRREDGIFAILYFLMNFGANSNNFIVVGDTLIISHEK